MVERRKIDNPFVVKVSREFEASPERVFDAWLDADNLGNWLFGTPDGKEKVSKVDPRVGGGFEIGEMRGDEFANHVGTYHEIDRPNKIVFSYYMDTVNNDLPSNVIIEFSPTDKGCMINLSHEMDDIWAEYEASAIEGWNMIFDGLSNNI